jgi:hypothetical protein
MAPLNNGPARVWGAAGPFDASDLGTTNSAKFTKLAHKSQANSRVARRRLLVTKLHRLGPASLSHFINNIERGEHIAETLERYAALPADFIRAYGGDRFPPALLCIDGGGP